MTRHRWGEKIAITPHKTERECLNGCGIVKVMRHEFEGGREQHWQEFWRDLDKIEGQGTPACTGRAAAAAYDDEELSAVSIDRDEFLPPEVYENGNGYFVICQEWPELEGDKYLRIMVAPDQAEALAHSLLALARKELPKT